MVRSETANRAMVDVIKLKAANASRWVNMHMRAERIPDFHKTAFVVSEREYGGAGIGNSGRRPTASKLDP